MNNEPVAWMHQNPDYAISKHQSLEYNIPLYTHPVKEQYKFGVDWSKDGNAVTVLKICEDGVAEVVFMDYQEATHPIKEHFEDEPQAEELHEILQSNAELTDEEIHQAIRRGFSRDGFLSDGIFLEIKELLRKAQEK